MPAGRPLKFASVEELQKKIDAYFADCKPHIEYVPDALAKFKEVKMQGRGKNRKEVTIIRDLKRGEYPNHWVKGKRMVVTEQKPVTITGLAYWLETSRETLLNYSKKEEFFDTIQRAKDFIQHYAENSLWEPKITSGVIFNLKNNWKWKDQTEVLNTQVPTGFEDLTDEQLKQQIEELRRKNNNANLNAGGIRAAGDGK